MNIKNYLAYFHDGTLIDIFHLKNKIELSLESAELTDEDIQEEIILSEQNTIRGKLHLENVKSIFLFLQNKFFEKTSEKGQDRKC